MEDQLHLEARNTIGVSDAVLLDDPNNTEAFIENLRKRFSGNLIYVSTNLFIHVSFMNLLLTGVCLTDGLK
jgi:hypothetical protein